MTSGLYSCIDRLVSNIDVQDKIIYELSTYKNVESTFDIPIVIMSRKMLAPSTLREFIFLNKTLDYFFFQLLYRIFLANLLLFFV